MKTPGDDRQIGRVLRRRELFALLGGAAATVAGSRLLAASAADIAGVPPCVVRPEQTEGPFFVEEHLNRADIRTDPADASVKPGIPLRLALRVTRVGSSGCAPMPGVLVDLWHCDAAGAYSDVAENGTVGKKFLRGSQVTDANGIAQFTTIYPGWYQGRAVHIHFKLRAATAGKSYDFTSQLYFDDSLSDAVFAQPPYAARGKARTRNLDDRIFREGGRDLMLALTKSADGYAGTFDIGLQLA